MEDQILDQVVLPRRALQQPKPSIAGGGDCGPCSLGGLLNVDIHTVYNHCSTPGVQRGISRHDVEVVLWWAKREGLIDRFVTSVPVWPAFSDSHLQWGYSGPLMSQDWAYWLRMAFDGGYYAITSVVHQGNGQLGDETDHIVLLCGWRCHRVPHTNVAGAARLDSEILVSCSHWHPEGQWYEVSDFLKRFGGYHAILVRPTTQ